jgi:hypothetical protein
MQPNAKIVWSILILLLFSTACSDAIVYIHDGEGETIDRSERTALLILPGLRIRNKGKRAIEEWVETVPYDVYVPDYFLKESLDATIEQLHHELESYQLDTYREVYAWVYILGGWTLNLYLQKYPLDNLTKIIYDRSPLQEQAARIVIERIPSLINMVMGQTLKDFRDTPYPSLDAADRKIGLVIETRASPYVRWHTEEVIPVEEENWKPNAFNQDHIDYCYVYLHHLEMYYSFHQIGDILLHFFETNQFPNDVQRTYNGKDPFQ